MEENTASHSQISECPTGHVLAILSYQIVYQPYLTSLETVLTSGAVSPWYLLLHLNLLALTASTTLLHISRRLSG